MIVGFTGTQEGMTEAQKISINYLCAMWQPDEFHHGDCIGADADFDEIVQNRETVFLGRLGPVTIVTHPPINESKRAFCSGGTAIRVGREPKEYLDRNKDIVKESEILIACPGGFEEIVRSGTWSTIRFSRKLDYTRFVVYPDGKIDDESKRTN